MPDAQLGVGFEEPDDDDVRCRRYPGTGLGRLRCRSPGHGPLVATDTDVADRLAVDEDPLAAGIAQPHLVDDLLAVDEAQGGTVVVVPVLRAEGH